jgi:hypothetical protein
MLPVACGVDLILNTFQSFDVGKCEPPLTQLTLTPTPHLTMAATWVLSGTRPTASRITAQLQSSHLHAHCQAKSQCTERMGGGRGGWGCEVGEKEGEGEGKYLQPRFDACERVAHELPWVGDVHEVDAGL